MSGGALFDYSYPSFEELEGVWRDAELDALVSDLLFGGEFSVRGYGGLLQTLDFWASGDVCEERYRESVRAFKAKWFGRTPEERAQFYAGKLQEDCERYKLELGVTQDDR